MSKIRLNTNEIIQVQLKPWALSKLRMKTGGEFVPDENGFVDVQLWVFFSTFNWETMQHVPTLNNDIYIDTSKWGSFTSSGIIE